MDPLRPFANIVRTLLTQRVRKTTPVDRTQKARQSDQQPPDTVERHLDAGSRLEKILKERLTQAEPASPELRQKIFVEVALLHELGDNIAHSSDFPAIAADVASQLSTHPELQNRLDSLLQALSRNARQPDRS